MRAAGRQQGRKATVKAVGVGQAVETPGTVRLGSDAAGIARAAAILARGGLVAFPTETVYGLGADARNARAVAAIFAAKGRPHRNPLIVHVAGADAAEALAVFDARARRLARAFWPGPLTLVLPLREGSGLAPMITAGRPAVALRVPGHPVALALLDAFGGPVAAPSANPSGRVSPTRADHVLAGLDGRIDAVLDGGNCPVGLESTIISLDGAARMLRPGAITAEEIAACLGQPVADRIASASERAPEAPGQLASHYAPRASLRLNALSAVEGEIFVGFGAIGGELNLSPAGELAEAAANLFAMLREADARLAALARQREGQTPAGSSGAIAVAPIPDRGIGRAINDRLRRAAAPRPVPEPTETADDKRDGMR